MAVSATTAAKSALRRWYQLGMGQQVLFALIVGISCGLFFGEYAAKLGIVGDIYIGLLQMMVLPYIILSLISGIGRLSLHQALQIAKYAVLVLIGLWVIISTTIIALAYTLPEVESASFYSTSLISTAERINVLDIFIPKNIFDSLEENQVPAIVVFCIVLGIALITAKDKESFLNPLDVLSEAVSRAIRFIIKLTPIGVFAMTASMTGTITFEELERLQGYFIAYTAAVLVLGFWLLPGLIVSLTPFSYRDVIKTAWPAVVLAFAAGKVLVVLPLIIERLNLLFEQYGSQNEDATATAKVIVPIAYPFPSTGKLMSLLFIPFAAWFVGEAMNAGEITVYLPVGILTYFGNQAVAMPFLLDYMKLPADMFQLFLLTGIYCGRISDGLGAMDVFTLSILVACAAGGMIKVHWHRLIGVGIVTMIIGAVVVVGLRSYNDHVLEGAYHKDETIASMKLLITQAPSTVIDAAPNPVPLEEGESPMERIRKRNIVRIGFHPDFLPYSYFNTAKELVGFDIGMAHTLARDLGVSIEFVPFRYDTLAQQLQDDHFDIAMGGVAGNALRSEQMSHSDPYMFVTMALIVPDYRDRQFSSLADIRELGSIKLGMHRDFAYRFETARIDIKNLVPEAELVVLDSYRDFFEQKNTGEGVDALITSAEGGSAWTLLYPKYQVVTPLGDDVSYPLVYPYVGRDTVLDEFLDHWIVYTQRDGTVKRLYDHWILGKDAEPRKPRWSVIRDVLYWVD